MNSENLHNTCQRFNFKLIKEENIKELEYLGSTNENSLHSAFELQHKSGTKLLYIENNDPEMSFCVGFKTLPKDSTGVFHILEHSVLCGSKKYPVKEPFTNLLKSSMQTFLNAMTFPDKTIYPVASTNKKDFYNLVNVYMDAVLFPNIYKNKNIFYQEGGHKTLEGFSGVVYNEMTGVYAEPSEHVFEGIMEQLYPGSCYSYSSGGKPGIIEKLTYEEFIAQHKANYSLSNAYIIIYGNLDVVEMLQFLDNNYLSCSDSIEKWQNKAQATKTGTWEDNYNYETNSKPFIKKVFTSKENTECCAGYSLPRDHKKIIASKILIDAIASSNESPLKSMLLKEKFAKEIEFALIAEIYKPFIIVECKNSKKGFSIEIISCIKNKIMEIAKNGIDKKLLNAAISETEYKLKEKLPEYTNGIDLTINLFSEWLYDENASLNSVKYIADINWLKEQLNTDYFDKLAIDLFVDNKHITCGEIVPTENLKVEQPSYTQEEKSAINKTIRDIKNWQNAPDTKEDEDKIPTLTLKDVGDIETYPKINKQSDYKLLHNLHTNGITYVNRYYFLNNISESELPYLKIISNLLGKLNTKKYSSEQIDVILQEKLGHFGLATTFYENIEDICDLNLTFSVRTSALDNNADYLTWFVDEILLNTQFDDYNKIKLILSQLKIEAEQYFIANGHTAALSNALSNILPINYYKNKAKGVNFYLFLKSIILNFDKDKQKICNKFKQICNKIFKTKPIISIAGIDVSDKIQDFESNLDQKAFWHNFDLKSFGKQPKTINAFAIPSNVNYCALTSDARLLDKTSNGAQIVGSKIIALDYLWNEVRVKNGAYGAGLIFSLKGTMQFYSYRDPNINKTFDNFINSCKWLYSSNISKRNLDNYIISSAAKIDAPISSRSKMLYLDRCYFSKIPVSKRENIRNEILNTDAAQIKESAYLMEQLLTKSSKSVFGNISTINKIKNDVKVIDLFNC